MFLMGSGRLEELFNKAAVDLILQLENLGENLISLFNKRCMRSSSCRTSSHFILYIFEIHIL